MSKPSPAASPALASLLLLAALAPALSATTGSAFPPPGTPAACARAQALGTDPRRAARPLAALGPATCTGGLAAGFPCSNVDLLSYLPVDSLQGASGNDVWGWTDATTGKEYALVGVSSGTAFVDVSDPANPVFLGRLPTHTEDSIWRGIKVYADHAYVVSEAANHGMQVFDLRQLRNVASPPVVFSETAHYDRFGHAHTIAVDAETGYAYVAGSDTCSGGLHFVDLADPEAPAYAGCFDADGYTHEAQCVVYHGKHKAYVGEEICFACDGGALSVVDVTVKLPTTLLSRSVYPQLGYVHQGWLTEDHAYFLHDDELDEGQVGGPTRTHLWDLSSLTAPTYMGYYSGPVPSIDHNLYIVGRTVYESNYTSGLRVLDLGCIGAGQLSEIGYFDIVPENDDPVYSGSWSNYPFFKSGIVLISGIEQGLFVVRPRPVPVTPLANGGGPYTGCPGASVHLEGAASIPCGPGGLTYRWIDAGGREVCAPSSTPACDVTPGFVPASYTLEIECADQLGCRDRATVTVGVDAEVLPSSLGNTLRAVRSADRVELSWGSDALARSYALYRASVKGTWPSVPFRERLASPADSEPDVTAVDRLVLYRSAGANCMGELGP